MPRARKPASVTTGHGQSKSELKARIEQEKKMKGSSDQLYQPPSIISMDEDAVEFYFVIIALLKDADILSNLDKYSVGLLADCLAKLKKSNEAMQNEGLKISTLTKTGEKEVVNPIYPIYKDALNNFGKIANQFGLTPSSRASLSDIALQQKAKEEDPLLTKLNSLNELRNEQITEKKENNEK